MTSVTFLRDHSAAALLFVVIAACVTVLVTESVRHLRRSRQARIREHGVRAVERALR